MQTRRQDDASLMDENQRLRVQLRKCNASRLQKESQIAHLQARAHQAEAAVAQKLRLEEAKYMIEFDHSVQALLKILKHHEEENEQLKEKVHRLSVAAAVAPPPITKITRSTQTKTLKSMNVAFRSDSVCFDKANDVASTLKDASSVEVKAKASSNARMQQLFERLQASIDEAESRN